jgi:hypothetical protein
VRDWVGKCSAPFQIYCVSPQLFGVLKLPHNTETAAQQ